MPTFRTSEYYYSNFRDLLKAPKEIEITEDAERAQNDFDFFCEYLRPVWKPAPHHREWTPHLVTNQDSECLKRVGGANTELLAPRGSAKSTRAAIFTAWSIGHNPHIQILYLSHSDRIALRQSRIIQRIIEMDSYRKVFPWIRPGQRWGTTDWEIDKELAGVSDLDSDTTLATSGILGSVIGFRAHLIVFDDIIKSPQAISNPEVREKMIDVFSDVIQPILIPGGRMLDVGTLHRPDDIHCTEFTEENGWKVVRQKAIIETEAEDGGITERVYWDRFNLEVLQKLRKNKPITFLLQYQNECPPDDQDAIIKLDWIKYQAPPSSFDRMCLGVDLATSGDDYFALVLVARRGDNFYVLDCARYRRVIGNVEKFKYIIEMKRRWGNFSVVVESVQYQASFLGDYKTMSVRPEFKELQSLRVEKVIPRGSKEERLDGVSGPFGNGLVWFNPNRPLQILVDELTKFPLAEHDDCMDACVYALQWLMQRSRRRLSAA